jgi:AraC-like DNA-binding protein
MHYTERAPIPALAHLVECVWTLDGHARELAGPAQPILPDGRRVARAVRAIDASGGLIAIDRLARSMGTTRRHLERLFLDRVGISPKRLARLTRFQRAVCLLEHEAPGPRGAATAHACGYADQAHFVRDFRELAECTPSAHLLRRAELTGFFAGTGPPR